MTNFEPKPSHQRIEIRACHPEIEASASSDPSLTPTPTASNSTPSIQTEKCGEFSPNLQSQVRGRSWEPFFLRRSTLLAFFVCFILQLAALITLYVYSSRNNGIVPVAAKYHQAWKYGPNAILAITIALWTQVDLRAKQVTVWSEFFRDVDAPSKSHALETDYLSKINLMALFLSLRRRHWPVAITIVGTLLLQLAAIFSTSLLERVTQPMSIETANLKTSAVFSDQTYDHEVPIFIQNNALSFTSSILQVADFKYPSGTTKEIAFETLDLPAIDGENEEYTVPGLKAYITANVPYIKPSVSCEAVYERFEFQVPLHDGLQSLVLQGDGRNIALSSNTSHWYQITNEGVDVSTIVIEGNLTINDPNSTPYTLEIKWIWFTPPTVPGDTGNHFWNINADQYARDCGSDGAGTVTIPTYREVLQDSCASDRVLWVVYGFHNDTNFLSKAANMSLTILECTPDEEVGEATLKFENDPNGASPVILGYGKRSSEAQKSYNTTALLWPISWIVHQGFGKWISADCTSNFNNLPLNCTPFSGTSPWESAGIKAALEAYYPIAAVQIFRSTLFLPGSRSISGIVDKQISRLTMTTVAFWPVAFVLGVLSLSCVFLLVPFGRSRTGHSLFSDPTTLGMSIISLQSYSRPKTIAWALESVTWRPGSNRAQSATNGSDSWRPWGTTSTSLWSTIVAITTLVGLLELTSSLSSSETRGLVLVGQSTWAYYGWTLVPSLLIAIIGLMVASLDFNIRVMTPFFQLKGRTGKSTNAILDDYIFGILPSRLLSFAQAGALGLVLTTLGTMVMPFCLAVTGGLFVLSNRPLTGADISLLQSDGFSEDRLARFNWSQDDPYRVWEPDIGDFPGIEFVPLPPFASDTSAMASFRLPAGESTKTVSDKFVSLTTTVTTGKLNCTPLASQCRVRQIPSLFNISQPIPCNERVVAIPVQNFGRKGCDPSIMVNPIVDSYCGDPEAGYALTEADVGRLHDYELDHNVSIFSGTQTRDWALRRITKTRPDFSSGVDDCPSLMRYGEEVFGDCRASRVGFAICDPYLESVQADVTFSLPSFDIVNVTEKASLSEHLPSNDPPVSKARHHIYGMARYLSIWSTGTFQINDTMIQNDDYGYISPLFLSILTGSGSDNPGSSETLTSGIVSLDDLLNAAIDPGTRDKIMSAVEYRWAKAMARIIRGYEKPFEEYDPPREVQAKLTDYDMRWLVQDEKSTRILQGLLGWAAFCLITAALIFRRGGRMDRVLREPPTSIGALCRLLAGSRLLATPMILDGASGDGDKESNGEGRIEERSAPVNEFSNEPPVEVDQCNCKWRKLFVASNTAQGMDRKELRRPFDVPGRVYCLKEWDVVEAGLSSEKVDMLTGGNGTDTGAERSQTRTRKRYGIDYEDGGEA